MELRCTKCGRLVVIRDGQPAHLAVDDLLLTDDDIAIMRTALLAMNRPSLTDTIVERIDQVGV